MAAAGVGWIQLRAKDVNDRRLCRTVEACLESAGEAKLWINDRVDLARLFPVAGVHLGQDDLPPAAARKLLGEEVWIGRSTHSMEQVREAAGDPDVDLLAVGPIFATSSKANPDPVVGCGLLAAARRQTDKPIVAIGGIDTENLKQVLEAAADAAAVLGAVCVGDVENNCRRLLAAAELAQ